MHSTQRRLVRAIPFKYQTVLDTRVINANTKRYDRPVRNRHTSSNIPQVDSEALTIVTNRYH